MATSHAVVWQRATVLEAVWLTKAIRRIVLAPEIPVKVEAGAHIDVMVELEDGRNGERDRRSYSVVDASTDGSRLAVSVFNSPASRGGAAVMHALSPGDIIEITQPILDFPLRVGAPRYLLLAGGIGITAIAGMARVLRTIGADYRLVYVGRARAEMAYLRELQELHGDRLQLHVTDEGAPLVVTALIADLSRDTELYMCGPIRLMDAVRRAFTERKLAPPNLRFETFGNSGWFDAESFEVRVPHLGITTTVSASQTMLEALETAGADMMFDCRKGECGLCEVRVLDLHGDIDHRDVFYSERQKDARSKMCCCVSRAVARPAGGAVVSIEI